MKNILVATDFSAAAENALSYVIEMYKPYKLKIDLLNVAPMQYVDEASLMSMESILESSKNQLKQTSEKIKNQFPDRIITIEIISKIGSPKQNILSISKDTYYDLLVMGMKGMSAIEKVLIGSTAAGVARSANCPVLIVPEKAKFNHLDRIVFATDYKSLSNNKILDPVMELARVHKSEIDFVNVNKYSTIPSFNESYEGLKLDEYFKDIKHTFHHSDEEKTEEGITRFIENKHSKMLVMLSRKHDFFEQLINPSLTKKMAYHIHIPMLVLHEQEAV